MKIHIITAALPPQLDGIGDYTANLAVELAKSAQIKILTTRDHTHAPLPNIVIKPAFSPRRPHSVRQLEPLVAADKPDWMLLQYNPFSYGRWGLNSQLPLTMRSVKRRSRRLRLAIMVHEPFVRVQNWKFALMSIWQRWQLWALGRSADVIFASIELWTRELQRWFPHKRVVHLPVGSNIPRVLISREEARGRLGVKDHSHVLGLFGSAHPGRLLGWVRDTTLAARRHGLDAHVLYMGPDGTAVQQALTGISILAGGRMPAEDVSRCFAAMDVYLAPFTDGVSTRRTSLMTGLQHGIPIVGTYGHNTDSLLRRADGHIFCLGAVTDPALFRSHVLNLLSDVTRGRELGQAGQRFYHQHFDWKVLASRLLNTLHLEN